MKTKISLLTLIMLILAFNISSVYADVIEPGKKEIKLSYVIDNINSYPYHVFLLHGNPSPTYNILNSSEFNFYKLSTASIYAVKRSKFNEEVLTQNNLSTIDNYFQDDPNVIHSNIELKGSYGTFDESNQLEKVLIVLEVVSVNDTVLEVKKSKIIFTFTDGSTQEQAFKDNNSTPVPTETKNNSLINYLGYIILPILAVMGLVAVLILRRRNKT